ncbi:hypothetical protein FSP39_023622 [Pinctada imbricata]|uniref:TIR domain-containing protein n=1 Tax=Pinctada imbricata TaxID=66713 RepID=A0AA88XSR1_PINIB|nr:hypothetical protein FSP39_023622 [Pinctada imbricata]
MAWFRLNLILLSLLTNIPKGRLECSNFYRWEKTNKLLFCPDRCSKLTFAIDQDRCCSCDAVPEWSCDSNFTSRRLYVEYTDIKGRSIVVDQENGAHDVIKMSHVNGYMSDFPVNLCDLPNTVEIDFSYNYIRKLCGISCLVNLDTIILKHNQITVVRQNTFLKLRHIRKVDLSYNRIALFELGTISSAGSGINHFDLSNNYLTSIDAIDIVLETPFCKTDLSDNHITEITNENEWVVKTNITYGSGGRVDFRGNQFTKFMDFEYLGFKDLTLLGKLMGFTFDIRDAKFPCDCKLQPFLALSEDVLAHVYRDFFKLRCASPEHMKGDLIVDLVRNKSLDMFVCEIKRNCSKPCRCYEQPSQNRTVVNCSNQGLNKMPRPLPMHHNLDIDLSGNNIHKIENVKYLSNISKIDLSDNNISTIPQFFVNKSRNAVNISLFGNNKIRKFPRNIQSRDPCAFQFGALTLDCSCNTIWVKEWLQVKGDGKCNISIMCAIDGMQNVSIFNISEETFGCISDIQTMKIVVVSMTVASIIIGVIAIISNMYQIEIYLMWRKFRQADQNGSSGEIRFDAIISLDEGDLELLSWVAQRFVPSLERRGYRLFFPFRDLDLGSIREESTRESLMQSRNVIIFLSHDYFNLEQRWTNVEWRIAWNLYTRFMDRKIIFVNYDHIRASIITNSVAKAFIRLRFCIEFTNRKHELMSEVRSHLGSPIERRKYRLTSARPLFRPNKIWSNVQLSQ